jgi:hypothetical protein
MQGCEQYDDAIHSITLCLTCNGVIPVLIHKSSFADKKEKNCVESVIFGVKGTATGGPHNWGQEKGQRKY